VILCPSLRNCAPIMYMYVVPLSSFLQNLFSDVNECKHYSQKHDCDRNAWCVNTPGSFICHCKKGYSGQGKAGTCNGESIQSMSTLVHLPHPGGVGAITLVSDPICTLESP
jgi:hypothetical protein